jgi:hypothetical protein
MGALVDRRGAWYEQHSGAEISVDHGKFGGVAEANRLTPRSRSDIRSVDARRSGPVDHPGLSRSSTSSADTEHDELRRAIRVCVIAGMVGDLGGVRPMNNYGLRTQTSDHQGRATVMPWWVAGRPGWRVGYGVHRAGLAGMVRTAAFTLRTGT